MNAYYLLRSLGASEVYYRVALAVAFSSAVLCRMAVVAQSDQVFFCVLTRVAPELLVVNFEMRHRLTDLAAPVVAPQDGPM